MKKGGLLLILLLRIFSALPAQNSDAHLRISILTCDPGEELYATFGHTAIRVVDSVQHTDLVYNFGTFDFDDPDFYSKFTRGKLDYFLSVSALDRFLYEYQYEQRKVTEQVLRLSPAAKQNLHRALRDNLSGPSRYYQYDFLYNNCTSRVRDLLIRYTGFVAGTDLVPAGTSFRNMLHEYLNKGAKPWSKLGIDLLLGSPIDRKVNRFHSMFLPDYLMKGLDASGMVAEKNILYAAVMQEPAIIDWPLIVFGALLLVFAGLFFVKNSYAKRVLKTMDFLLFLLTGLMGILLVFMWLGTDHKACAANYNLLLVLPVNLWAAFALWKGGKWVGKYFRLTAILFALMMLCWYWLPQQLNIALFPLTFLLCFRSLQLSKDGKHV
ncbi:MAG: hypothetical protein RLZZ28_2307 [Bacteroidota bacterium]